MIIREQGKTADMIMNEWYAVLSSREVKKGRITAARRFGKDLVFFRDEEGKAGCFGSLCAHRKASLAKGWVEQNHIKCPFHGIEYDVTGKCVYVPSEGRASQLNYERLHLDAYPVREIGDILFVWYGDREPDHEPACFDLITDSSYTWDETSDHWTVDYSRVIENQLDVSHLSFVHHNTIGRGNKTVCNGPKVIWLDERTMRTSADNEKDTGQKPKPAEDSRIKDTNLTFRYPNMWLNHISDKIQVLAYFVPVDDENSIISLRFYNKITGNRAIDKTIAWLGSRANKIVERQDKRIVETQLPKKTGLRINENLVAADLPIAEYRTKREKLQNRDQKEESIRKEGKKPMENNPKAMYRLSYGLFVCTAVKDGRANGCIINTAVQIASDPNTISIAVNKENLTCSMIHETGQCNVSVIGEDATFELFQRFGFQSGRDVNKFEGYEAFEMAGNGIPYIIEGTNAYFSLKVKQEVDLGSHILFICEPVFMTVLSEVPSCTYAYYQSNIKPKPQAVGKTAEGKTVWRCVVCGYEWEGEELPDDFLCPICKHPKVDFEKIVK